MTTALRGLLTATLMLFVSLPAAAQETALLAAAPRDGGWKGRWDGHPEIDWGGRLHVEIHGRLQTDGSASEVPLARGEGDGWDLGRRRIGVEGTAGRHVEFQVEAEIASTDPWRDVWVNYRPLRAVQIQAGQFKLPFGLEETTSSRSLDFIHRSLASTHLAPGRDRGLMLHGRLRKGMFGYEVGAFTHDGDNARPNSNRRVWGGATYAGRVIVEPFAGSKSGWADLQLGLAYARTALPKGFPSIRGRSVLGLPFFDSDLWVAGGRRRTGLQARWRPGPFSFASEVIRVADDRRGQSQRGIDLAPFRARGWYVSGAWVVAGARRATGVARPRHPLFQGGFGSIQLAMRLERFSLGRAPGTGAASTSPRAESVLGNGETAMTFGATWHPNRWVAIHGNFIREAFGEAGRTPYPSLRSWSRLVQFQVGI